MGSVAIQPKVQPLVLGGGTTMPPVKMRAGPLHLHYKLCTPRSSRDRQQCNYHSPAAFTNYSIAFGLPCHISQTKPELVQNISKPSSRMISHHVNSPTPTQYVTTLLTKPGVTAASVYHKRRRFLPALEPFLLQSSIAFTV